MGKSSSPAAPDYTPVANADAKTAQLSYNLGEQQIQNSQNQFSTMWPYAQQYLQSQISATSAEQSAAQAQQGVYNSTYLPIEQQLASEVQNYNSPAQANQAAGEAMTDVANSFEGQRNSSLQQLESYGIDPSQTRYGALDLSSRVSQAAATAAAGTQSRLNTQATGMALQGNEVNVGRGYGSSIAQDYSTATQAGSAGLGAGNSTFSTSSDIAGNANASLGEANSANSGITSALGSGYSDQYDSDQINNQASQNMMSGIGSLAGMGMMAMAL